MPSEHDGFRALMLRREGWTFSQFRDVAKVLYVRFEWRLYDISEPVCAFCPMRQHSASIFSGDGKFLLISDVSAAAEKAGITTESVIGSRLGDWGDRSHQREARQNFVDALFEGRSEYQTRSNINGDEEHWRVRLFRIDGDAAVLSFSTQLFPGDCPRVTPHELQMLRLMADDHGTEEIAARMQQSHGAISGKLSRLRTKFRVHTNAGLIAKAARFGLLTGSG